MRYSLFKGRGFYTLLKKMVFLVQQDMKRHCISLLFLSIIGILVTSNTLMAQSELPLWDNAVNRLLAAGLYGVDLKDAPAMAMRFEQNRDLYKGLAADKSRLNGQSITFSYEGSSGLLGFSAGYIYTSGTEKGNLGSVYLGLDDPMGFNTYDPTKAWYIALDLSTSYQPYDNISLGLVGKTMLMKDPYGRQDGQLFSFLLNMPVSYKKYITITPELQWSRPLSGQKSFLSGGTGSQEQGAASKDVFFGGVSISFSY